VATPLLRSHVLTDQPATARGEAAGLSSSTQNTSSGSVARPLPRHHILEPARPLVSEETPSYVKRRKTFGKLTVRGGSCDDSPYDSSESSRTAISTPRQLQIKSREYPQRKKRDDHGVCQLQPSSVEKFIAGVWKQIYSSVELAPMSLDTNHDPIITSSPNYEAFRAINSLCLRITTIARCSHSLETIIQAHWVDCFDHRVKEIGIEKPFLSNTDTKMSALREACTILTWSEKELRNRLYVLAYARVFRSMTEPSGADIKKLKTPVAGPASPSPALEFTDSANTARVSRKISQQDSSDFGPA